MYILGTYLRRLSTLGFEKLNLETQRDRYAFLYLLNEIPTQSHWYGSPKVNISTN